MSDAKAKRRYEPDAKAWRVLRRCEVMRGLLPRRRAEAGWELRRPYDALISSIVGQQISWKVAAKIRARLRSAFRTQKALAEAPIDELRAVGLSQRKAEYVRAIAQFARGGGLRGFAKLADDEVVERLVAIRGVGEWTAHMFLMFALGRVDVWPVGDFGILTAAQKLYGVEDRAQLVELGERFAPFRSAAAVQLWRALD